MQEKIASDIQTFTQPMSIRRALHLRFIALRHRCSMPRSMQLYCVGLPKSGTHSIAGLFEREFRTAHEPFPSFLIANLPLAANEDAKIQARLIGQLRLRDRVMSLDLESSHLLGDYWPLLVRAMPEARFLVPVRSPIEWLESLYNDELNLRSYHHYDLWHGVYRHYFQQSHGKYPAEEKSLRDRGLFSARACLEHWARYHQRMLGGDSAQGHSEKFFVFPIQHLHSLLAQLAEFSGVRVEQLNTDQLIRYPARKRHNILDSLPSGYTQTLMDEICLDIWQKIHASYSDQSIPSADSI